MADDPNKILKDVADYTKIVQKQIEGINKTIKDSVNKFGMLVDQAQKLADQEEKVNRLTEISFDISRKQSAIKELQEKQEIKINKLKESGNFSAEISARKQRNVMDKVSNDLSDQFNKIQSILSSESDKLKLLKSQQNIYSTFLKPAIGDSKEYSKIIDLGTKLMKGGMEAYLVIIDAAIERWIALDKAAAKFRQDTGLILPQMEKIAKSVREVNVDMANLGVTLDKAYEAAGALVEAFQTSVLVSKDMVANAAQMSANVGLSVKDMAEFNSKFSETAKVSGTTTKNIMESGVALARMAGVAPRQAMNDMAKASGNTLLFLSKAPMAMMRAAIEARRMGTTLDSIANSARGMLNYQDSMTSELEASALLNKNISFQQSRQLAWEGKIVEAREAALKQIQSVGDFTKLTVYQQESLAKAAGLTVEEVTKQLNQQKALAAARAAATGKDADAFKAYDEHIKKLRNNDTKTQADLVKEGQAIIRNQQMQAKMEQITNALTAAWTDLTDAMLPIADVIMPVIVLAAKGIGYLFKGIGYAIKNWGSLFLVAKTLQLMGGYAAEFLGITKQVSSVFGFIDTIGIRIGLFFLKLGKSGEAIVGVIESVASWIGKIGSKFGLLAEGAGVVGRIGALFGKWIPVIGWIITAIQFVFELGKKLMSIWSDPSMSFGDQIIKSLYAIPDAIFDCIVSPIIDLVAWVAKLFGADVPDSMVDGIKSVGKEILQWLIFPFMKGYEWLKEKFLGNSPSGIGLEIVDGIKAVGGMIFNFLCSPFTRAWDMIKKLPLVGKIFGAVGDAAKAVGGEISAKVEAATSTVVEIKNLDVLNEAIDKLTAAVTALGGTAGGAATIIPGNDNSTIVSKLDELIGLMQNGGIAVNLDGRKVSSALSSAGR